jgi:heat shock protein HtpX
VLAVSGAKEANPKEYSALCATVEGLAAATQIKQPRVYVINDPNPNAFATGRRSNPSVAVTTGLLAALSKQELEGVIAHEISHISDNDILVMTMAIAFAGAIGLIAVYIRSIFWYGSAFRGGDRRDNNGSGTVIMIAALLVSVLAPLCALLIRLAISRKREYMADANGARIIRNPAALANALKKIGSYTSRPNVPGVTKANEVTAPMYFSNPLKVGSITSNLFSTHPPIEDRIAKLEHMY